MRSTLSDAKDPSSGIARVLNLDPTDTRFSGYVNESQRRLLRRGKFWGTYASFRMCVTDGCLVWPRQIAAIEAVAVCNEPITIRNSWFEFLENSAGLQGPSDCSGSHSCGCGANQLHDRGTAVAFADIRGTNKKIRVYADVAEAADAKILLQGYDENNIWIRTESSPGVWVDGEYVAISTTPTNSTKFFSALVAVQKPVTNGIVRMFEYNNDTTIQRPIAIYEPDETRPNYRKSFIQGLPSKCCGECETATVTVMAKLEFIAATKDTDWLIIGNLDAIKDMCQSIRKTENNLFDEATAWEAKAIVELQRELRHYLGGGIVQPLRMARRNVSGAGVMNMT